MASASVRSAAFGKVAMSNAGSSRNRCLLRIVHAHDPTIRAIGWPAVDARAIADEVDRVGDEPCLELVDPHDEAEHRRMLRRDRLSGFRTSRVMRRIAVHRDTSPDRCV
jgi:hypothetical protein